MHKLCIILYLNLTCNAIAVRKHKCLECNKFNIGMRRILDLQKLPIQMFVRQRLTDGSSWNIVRFQLHEEPFSSSLTTWLHKAILQIYRKNRDNFDRSGDPTGYFRKSALGQDHTIGRRKGFIDMGLSSSRIFPGNFFVDFHNSDNQQQVWVWSLPSAGELLRL